MNIPVVMSWSGGKDSAMALHEVHNAQQYDVVALLTCVSEEYRRISHHGIREVLLEEQAEAIGIPLHKQRAAAGLVPTTTASIWWVTCSARGRAAWPGCP